MWKVSKYGVISGPYSPIFGLNTGEYGPEITSYLDTFRACIYLFTNAKSLMTHLSAKELMLLSYIMSMFFLATMIF